MAYATVHRIVRYELGAKLKVPPPRQQQQTVGVQEDFKTSKKLLLLLKVLQAVKLRYVCQDFVKTRVAGDCSPLQDAEGSSGSASRPQPELPPNVIPVLQLPYTPEVNPIEWFWQYLRATLAWRPFETLEALRQKPQDVLSQITAAVVQSLRGWSYITQPLLAPSSH